MTTYRVYLSAYASTAISVEADTQEEAEDLAFDQLPSLCAQCTGWGRPVGLELGDFTVDSSEVEA